jgi:hypothetical protein
MAAVCSNCTGPTCDNKQPAQDLPPQYTGVSYVKLTIVDDDYAPPAPVCQSPANGDSEDKQCRICLDYTPDHQADKGLIAPCRCKGTHKWTHRACIDHWRATDKDGRAFTHCPTCHFQYLVHEDASDVGAKKRRCKYRTLVGRDTMIVFLGIQVFILVLGEIVKVCDPSESLRYMLLPKVVSASNYSSYYVFGFVLLLAGMGFVGLCSMICKSGERDGRGGYHNDPCGGCYGCYCGDCSCGDGKCSGGGGADMGACVVMLILVVVVFAFIGIFIGIFMASALVNKIYQRHMHVLWLKEETKKFVIVDLHEAGIDAGPRPL